MNKMLNFLSLSRRLSRNTDGVAAVEFALISPLLILIFFGVVEVSNLLITDMKARTTAAVVGDLITQDPNGVVSEDNLDEIATAVHRVMFPLRSAMEGSPLDMAVVITVFMTQDVGGTITSEVRWSRILPNQNSVALETGTVVDNEVLGCSDVSDLPNDLADTGNDVARVAVYYDWRPWFTTVFATSPIALTAVNFNMPRYATRLQPDTTLSPTCTN